MIYRINNTLTGDFYVGFTTKPLKARLLAHLRNSRNGQQTHLGKAVRKYGAKHFVIQCLQWDGTLEDEVRWIKKLKPRYNMTPGGEGGDTSASPNWQKAIKRVHAIIKARNGYATFGMLGKRHSSETKRKQSAARFKYWKELSPSQRKRRGSAVGGAKNGMFGKSPGNAIPRIIDGVTYPSMRRASEALKMSVYQVTKLYNEQRESN